MAPKLYYVDVSPPCRAVLLTFKALGVEFEPKNVDLASGQHLTPAFLKINPQHSVPTLDDGGFILNDSHAIVTYLAEKYGQNDSLYPKDLQKRTIVNQRLFFDDNVIQPRLGNILRPIFREGAKTVPKEKADAVLEAYGYVEGFLQNHPYVAGDQLTVADFSLSVGITTANVVVPIAANRFPNITDWLARMQSLPYWREAGQEGLDKAAAFFKSRLN